MKRVELKLEFAPSCKLYGIYAAILRSQKMILHTVYIETAVSEKLRCEDPRKAINVNQ